MSKRQSDNTQSQIEFDRSNSRTYSRDSKWYFASREGEFGPFDSESEAVGELESYVQLIDLRAENEGPVTPD